MSKQDNNWQTYSALLAEFDHGSRNASITEDMFDTVCALEQVLADARLFLCTPRSDDSRRLLRACQGLRRIATDVARFVWLGSANYDREWFTSALRDLRIVLPERSAMVTLEAAACSLAQQDNYNSPPAVLPVQPESHIWGPVDPLAYVAAVQSVCTSLDLARCAIIGLRSSGSYLAPLWAAVLDDSRCNAVLLTLRATVPGTETIATARRHRIRVFPRGPHPDLDAFDMVGRQVVLVDDSVDTGSTARAALSVLYRHGARPADVKLAVHRNTTAEDVHHRVGELLDRGSILFMSGWRRSLPPRPIDPSAEAACQRYLRGALADLGNDYQLVAMREIGPSYAAAYIAARSHAEPHAVDAALRDCGFNVWRPLLLTVERRSAVRTVVAKYVGFGPLARVSVDAMRTCPVFPEVLGLTRGYLFYLFVEGEQLPFGRGLPWTDSEVRQLALSVAHTVRTRESRTVPADALSRSTRATMEDLSRLDVGQLAQLADVRFRIDEPYVTLVQAPRSYGHWHFIRNRASGVTRTHQDIAHVERWIDPIEDLAGIVFECSLDDSETEALLRAYQALVPTSISEGRAALATLRYLGRVLADYAAWDRVAERVVRTTVANANTMGNSDHERRRAAAYSCIDELTDRMIRASAASQPRQ